MKRNLLFLDSEFTGLHQQAELISLGIVSDTGSTFYAEFIDYDPASINPWLKENVIAHLQFGEKETSYVEILSENHWQVRGDKAWISSQIREYLKQFEQVECWWDYVAYDWVLFCELFGGSMNLPEQVYYIPFDLMTLFYLKGEDPDINREKFLKEKIAQEGKKGVRHNALWDARLTQWAYQKLTE
ncbi:MAG: 3'-5' exoribonuclease [Bacteroidota bacterium]